ncbi:MAG: 23S rRNA pseudouridine(955/2504/2580) synthase RluC [Porticoccaceae bacterium]
MATGEPTGSETGVRLITISEDEAGQRIDNFLLARLKGVPKSRIYRLLRKGEVRVNKGRIKPEYRLAAGDSVRVPPIRVAEGRDVPAPGLALRAHLESSVLFENGELLVINKPQGLAVHGGSGVSLGLIEALRATRPGQTLELVHRLDKGTSGCLLIAKKRAALRALQNQLRDHEVEKIYLALVDGVWPKGLDVIDAPLDKVSVASGENFVRASRDGKNAVTRFRIHKRYADMTMLEVALETGRTHQIRVHCQLAGHPLLGDDKYGSDARNEEMRKRGLKRIFLHAHRLCFAIPSSGEQYCVEAPLPADLAAVLGD